jgi:hypothetical protein
VVRQGQVDKMETSVELHFNMILLQLLQWLTQEVVL